MNYPFNATQKEVDTLRALAFNYMQIALNPKQEKKRELWRRHNALEKTQVPVICSWLWSSNTEWDLLRQECICKGGILLFIERWLRNRIFHDSLDDDMVLEPWIPIRAVLLGAKDESWGIYTDDGKNPSQNIWGENQKFIQEGNAWKAVPMIFENPDIKKHLHPVLHQVNEEETQKRLFDLQKIFADSLPIYIDRGSIYKSTYGGCDLSEALGKFLGIENIYYLVYDNPELMHALATFMQNAILQNFESAEKAGDFLPDGTLNANVGMPYTKGMQDPGPKVAGTKMRDLWIFTHGQEFNSFSAQMHKEFLLDYQIPILNKFAASSYGCCEDLSLKIDMLRHVPNLKRIAVAPVANIKRCAEEIGQDYCICWRPNPAPLGLDFDEDELRKEINFGLSCSKDCVVDIMLKDVMTVAKKPHRLKQWVSIVKEEAIRVNG